MKKEITLKQAHQLLQLCPVIGLEGRYIVPSLFCLEDDEDEVFMYLNWTEIYDEDPIEFTVEFHQSDNVRCELDGCELVLVNSDGEEEVLELFTHFYPDTADLKKY